MVDLIRFMSIFIVMGSHFFNSGAPPVPTDQTLPLRGIIQTLFQNGSYGVTCFFVVSGYLITQMLVGRLQDYGRTDLREFYVKRAARIFPLLLLVILLGLGIMAVQPQSSPAMDFCFRQKYSDFSWGFWLSLFTFTFNWFVIFKAEAMKLAGHWGVMWSLAVEEQFYLGYPLVLRVLRTRRRAFFFLLLVILSGVLFRAWVYFENIGGFGMSQIASFAAFDQIAIGAAAFLMQDRFEKEARRIPWLRILFLCAGLALFMAVYTETAARSMGDWILGPTILALGCALMILGGNRGEWGSFWKLISWPGKFSYGCYLLHMTALFIFWNVYGQINPFAALSLFMISTWLLAYLSYRYFEVPANVRIRAAFNIKSSRTF